MKLLRSQSNDVYKALVAAGLDPGDFEWLETAQAEFEYHPRELPFPTLKHLRTDSFFLFGRDDDNDLAWTYYPNRNGTTESSYGEWDDALGDLSAWAEVVKSESEVDLWTATHKQGLIDRLAATASADLFSERETEALRRGIQELKNYAVQTYQLVDANAELVMGRLDYLESELETQGKRAWFFLAMGVFLDIGRSALTSEQAADLFAKANDILGPILDGLNLLPPVL